MKNYIVSVMSGAESYAFEPGMPGFDQRPYGEQPFDPTLLSQEFARRQQRFGEFVAREIGAFHLHEGITQELVRQYGEPQYLEGENGFQRNYEPINYEPVPGDSEQRRFIRIGERVTARDVRVPLMTVASVNETHEGETPAKLFVRGELRLIHQMLQNHTSTPPTNRAMRSYADAFMSQGAESEWVKKQIATQQEYVGWLRIVAGYIGVAPILRQYVVAQQPRQISQN